MTDVELPGQPWHLKEIMAGTQSIGGGRRTDGNTFVIFQSGPKTNAIEGELLIWKSNTGGAAPYMALLNSKDVTHRLTQRRWDEIYCKAIAGQALLGRKPEIIEQIF